VTGLLDLDGLAVCENAEMPGKMILTLEVDANEAEILIAVLAKAANLAEAAKHGEEKTAEILDRLRHQIEEQVG
jgi:glutamate formiminotransferase